MKRENRKSGSTVYKRVLLTFALFFLILMIPHKTFAENQARYVVISPILDVHSRPSAYSERVTQALFNERVLLLQKSGSWAKVRVLNQSRDGGGYPGWVKVSGIEPEKVKLPLDKKRVMINSGATKIYYGLKKGSGFDTLYFGTVLNYLGYREDKTRKWRGKPVYWLKCERGDGRICWVFYGHAQIIKPGHRANVGTALVYAASRFEGTRYLWGGMSIKGIDCSGLTYLACLQNGITIPRDADEQFKKGTPVSMSSLSRGDLVFFGRGSLATHVGIYAGSGWIIHAGRSSGVVQESLSSPSLMKRYIGARRFVK